MAKKETNPEMTAEEMTAHAEELLTRLERALLSREGQEKASVSEQILYIQQLEEKNKQLTRDQDEMKKHCIALKSSYEALEKKYASLENITAAAEKNISDTLSDLDKIIAQKSLH